ncbi:MAG: CheR family methyltransferase [Candidatus Latescibacterota bacterium]
MPDSGQTGMAFILVQHLAPDHKSILTELVGRYTRMQVFEVEDGMTVAPDCAYIIPPNRNMALLGGRLQLLEPTAPRGLRLPIDFFFRSLAQDQRDRAICIVLSGTGSDGTLGVRAIKGEGGMAMAQDPATTEFGGMPGSAIATGIVDYVLPPEQMPGQLAAFVARAFSRDSASVMTGAPEAEEALRRICLLLRDRTGHDFTQYKRNTLVRRLERRMALQQVERPDQYLRVLQSDEAEVQALFGDLLIGVTSFFRDPEAFATLQAEAIPPLLAGRPAGAAVRAWVCGCSTGEEAYSIAILIKEHLESLEHPPLLQVFATDIDGRAIEQARRGVYPVSIAADVSTERLARFFDQEVEGAGTYRVRKGTRDLLVFSAHDATRDPPFSKMDLISCRNLLIYLNPEVQAKLMALFHYALNPGGVLFLGGSETVGESAELYAEVNRVHKVYLRREATGGAVGQAPGYLVSTGLLGRQDLRWPNTQARTPDRTNYRRVTEQALLQHYAQVGVLIDARGEILHIHGRTGRYLEPAPGDAGMNILAMAREGLRRELTTAVNRAVMHREPVRYQRLRVRTDGETITANLTVKPVVVSPEQSPGASPVEIHPSVIPDLFLVLLEEIPPEANPSPVPEGAAGGQATVEPDAHLARLEQELQAKEEYLQSALEEMATANEELQSINEELQSTNEELETSREELQSVNEELATVNGELQTRVSDLSHANDDMSNLLAGTGVATLFLDLQMNIRRFTPAVTQVINLIASDIGRPLAHVVSNLANYDRLVADVTAVLDTLTPAEIEVQTVAGTTFLMRIRPYRTLDNAIEGAVVIFIEITERKRLEASLRQDRATLCESIVAAAREPMVVLDRYLRVTFASRAFCALFQVRREDIEGRLIHDLGGRQWDMPELRGMLEAVLTRDTPFDDFEVRHDFGQSGQHRMRLNARRIAMPDVRADLILLAIEIVSDKPSTDLRGA